jgi:ATP-dependent RNA helicase DDX54/DBP10
MSAAFLCRCGRAARAGRSGSALCLLTREELPFLLDLHLYLGRTVRVFVLQICRVMV